MSCGLFTLNLAQKGISKLPEKSQNEQSLKNGPSHGDRANVVTGRDGWRARSQELFPLGPTPVAGAGTATPAAVPRTVITACTPDSQVLMLTPASNRPRVPPFPRRPSYGLSHPTPSKARSATSNKLLPFENRTATTIHHPTSCLFITYNSSWFLTPVKYLNLTQT